MLTTEFMQSAGLMVLVLAWSVVLCRSDWRQRKLPNAWTMGAAVVILVFRLGYGGIPFFLNGVAAALLAGAFLFIPFLMRGAGAGDLKMLFACGALVGMGNVLDLMVYTALAGVVLALALLAAGRVDAARVRHGCRSLFDWTYDRKAGAQGLPPRESERVRVPFSLAIAAGLLATLVLGGWLSRWV
jgi:prepilin peptidase CpaA